MTPQRFAAIVAGVILAVVVSGCTGSQELEQAQRQAADAAAERDRLQAEVVQLKEQLRQQESKVQELQAKVLQLQQGPQELFRKAVEAKLNGAFNEALSFLDEIEWKFPTSSEAALVPTERGKIRIAALAQVGPIIWTDKVDEMSQAPIGTRFSSTIPRATDLIYATAKVNLQNGQRLTAHWYFNGAVQEHLRSEVTGDRNSVGVWAAFHISNHGNAWPPGAYRVVLKVDGRPMTEAEIQVK